MQISLKFIEQSLNDDAVYVRLHDLKNPFFDSIQLYSSDTPIHSHTLYLTLSQESYKNAIQKLPESYDCGLICFEDDSLPQNIPLLVFRHQKSPESVFQQISGIFSRFQKWSEKVSRYILEKRPLSEIFSLLKEVTPNPWYLADTSFRILVYSPNSDFEDMSVIWKNQCQLNHLSIDIILDLAESGELDLINSRKHSFIPDTQVFNIPYVAKNIFSSRGLLAHFFIIGLYNKPGAYETEIAELFGNLLTSLLKGDNNYLTVRGRYYDNYFIDLLENKISSEDDAFLIRKVFSSLGWNMDQQYMILLLSSRKNGEAATIMNNLQLNALESSLPCRAFIYEEKVVLILNATLSGYNTLCNNNVSIINTVKKIASNFGSFIACSDPFYIHEGLDEVPKFYKQAKSALDWGKTNHLSVASYKNIALSELYKQLVYQHMEWTFLHPSVLILDSYDKKNDTLLCQSLLYYLVCEQNTVRTAKCLYVHRNSLIYRLDKIKELTHLDFDNVHERIRIILTLLYLGYECP